MRDLGERRDVILWRLRCGETQWEYRFAHRFFRQKNKRTYVVFTQTSQKYAEFAHSFLDRRTYFVFTQNSRNDTELAPRIYTYLHGKILTQRRKGTRSVMFFCSSVQSKLHTELTEIHRNLASHVLRMSAPSALDNYTLRMGYFFSRKGAKGAKRYVLLFFCLKILSHRLS